ncbi:cyclic peptide export ABC transporter [Paraburkholderia sp. BCC1885]|uniref:cyclic peptide export ABC transporter n=1 Tax=Paraburkholderia sp. BCC1885 TaxID=2562669 RepID=UPI0011829FE1|nr:cyclic peptide export ABC transporter [Paraburkholderia sp. BCC1885]
MDSISDQATEQHFSRELFRLLRPFWRIMLLATLMGLVGGGSTAWLLATINAGLHVVGDIPYKLIETFVALCLVSLIGNMIAGVGNVTIGQRVVATLRKDISARIICAPIAAIERFSIHRILATLNNDVDTVSVFTFNFPVYGVSFAIITGCVAYMLMLSPLLFAIAAVAIVIGLLINQYSSRRWRRYYEGVRGAQDELQKQYRAITEGAKELRLSRERRFRVYSSHLSGAADEVANLKIHAMRLFYATNVTGATLFFLVIGLILLLRTRLGVSTEAVSGFVVVLLYVRGPVEQLASGVPAFSQARIAFQRIAELAGRFQNREAFLLSDTSVPLQGEIRSIELNAVRYSFPAAAGKDPFQLGPVDLEVHRGEMLFVVGENGSGKTTLIKLLLGLYTPESGTLLVDGQPLDVRHADAYRQNFSAIFSDYYLFDELVVRDETLLERANEYMEQLEIAHKVHVADGRFSTIDLSSGQRKRLALVQAMLEQRPVMMFDEWAADQDPTFRRLFYTQFLPELKRQGKTLIVVSHDDRFFGMADRVVRLEHGKIVEISTGAAFRYVDVSGSLKEDDGRVSGAATSGLAVPEFHEGRRTA